VYGVIAGNLSVSGAVKGSFPVNQGVGKVLDFTGSAETVVLRGESADPVLLQPDAGGPDEAPADKTRPALVKAARFGYEVVIGDNIKSETAEFDNSLRNGGPVQLEQVHRHKPSRAHISMTFSRASKHSSTAILRRAGMM